MDVLAKETAAQWAPLAPLFAIHNEREYAAAIERMKRLFHAVAGDARHPLCGLMETLAAVIHCYEETVQPPSEIRPPRMLQYLMHEHALEASDLAEIGSPAAVAQVLGGGRELSTRQIRILAKRFDVSPAVFF